MRKQLKFFVISYILFLLFGMFSCQGDDCGPFSDPRQKLVDMRIELLNFEEDGDSRTTTPIFSDSIRFDALAIEISTEFASINENQTSSNGLSFGLLQEAYACTPAPPYTEEELLNIEIFGTNDFSAQLPAGSDLSELFDVIEYDTFNTLTTERMDLKSFLNSQKMAPIRMTLVLRDAPEIMENHQFRVKISLKGAAMDFYEFTTPSVDITKS